MAIPILILPSWACNICSRWAILPVSTSFREIRRPGRIFSPVSVRRCVCRAGGITLAYRGFRLSLTVRRWAAQLYCRLYRRQLDDATYAKLQTMLAQQDLIFADGFSFIGRKQLACAA